MGTAHLALHEADELLTAHICRRADHQGVRLLVLKGMQLSVDGLRPKRVSSDVDVLVEPQHFDAFCDSLRSDGWSEFDGSFLSERFTTHSRTFRLDGWPNSLDVHRMFPGFLREPEAVFDLLWAGRRIVRSAHRECSVPSRAANVLVLALHSLRGERSDERHDNELEALVAAPLTDAERAEVARLAATTGASTPLAPVLSRLGIRSVPVSTTNREVGLSVWNAKVEATHGAGARWLAVMRTSRWRERPAVIRHALWPSRADFAAQRPDLQNRFWPMARGRLVRLGRGVIHLPATLTTARRSRRERA